MCFVRNLFLQYKAIAFYVLKTTIYDLKTQKQKLLITIEAMKHYAILAILEDGQSCYVKVNESNVGICSNNEPEIFKSFEECQRVARHIKTFDKPVKDLAFDVCYL